MWAAGPCCNEFPQVLLNSFDRETGMLKDKFDEIMKFYYGKLEEELKAAGKECNYPYDTFMDDLRLNMVDMWLSYIGFSAGASKLLVMVVVVFVPFGLVLVLRHSKIKHKHTPS